jgi:hypothetical protein
MMPADTIGYVSFTIIFIIMRYKAHKIALIKIRIAPRLRFPELKLRSKLFFPRITPQTPIIANNEPNMNAFDFIIFLSSWKKIKEKRVTNRTLDLAIRTLMVGVSKNIPATQIIWNVNIRIAGRTNFLIFFKEFKNSLL